MIKVTVQKHEGLITNLKVSGHSNSAEYGRDLVCAGVSCILTGGANALDILTHDDCEVTLDEGFFEAHLIHATHETDTILNTVLIQLKTIQEQYSRFIKITITEV